MKENFEKPIDPGIRAFVEAQVARREALSRALEQIPFTQEVFTPETLARISTIEKDLETLSTQNHVSPENGFSAIEGYLDSHRDFWSSKFRTGEEIPNDVKDSLYYVTPQGISLRLKKIHLQEDNLARVIQPFMEKVFFESADDKQIPDLRPVIGSDVIEYCSVDFRNAIKSKSRENFTSRIKVFRGHQNQVLRVHNVEDARNQYHTHHGHEVNRIIF